MRESISLRALEQSLSTNTVFILISSLIFLALLNIIFKRLKKRIHNNWLTACCSAWLSGLLMFSAYVVIIFLLRFISEVRFGTKTPIESDWPFFFGIPSMGLKPYLFFYLLTIVAVISSFVLSAFYGVYFWLKENWANKFKSTLQPIFSSLIILILINLSLGFFLLLNAKLRLEDVLLNLAVWSPIWTGITLAFLLYEYFQYFDKHKMQEKELQISKLKQQVTQSQLDALSSKINPHFLYNALNSIAGLSTEDNIKTREMAIALSKLFRYNINRDESSYAIIQEEVEMAALYLEIEKIRFEDRIKYTCHIQPGIENESIPRHLLQPLVENAVKHGMNGNHVDVSITIEKNENGILIKVGDKGRIFDTSFNPGYGLKSLYDKLDILAPDRYEISFSNTPKEVVIYIAKLKMQA